MSRLVAFKGLRILIMISMVLALVVSLSGSALAQAPKMELKPTTVPASKTLVVTLTGFKPKEAVVVLLVGALAGEDIIVTGGECDDKGTFASPAKRVSGVAEMAAIPGSVKPGKYTLKATGTAGSTASAEVTVTPQPTPTPKPAATPVAKAAATPAAKAAATPAAKAAVPKTGAPLPIAVIALAGIGLGAIGFALRRKA
ncbi:MAG: hypothetical protein ABIH46_11410 [Chloroflexota bacterium]